MKSVRGLAIAAALWALAAISPAAVAQQVGALAIDRSKGYIYGFAHDYATRAEAERRAQQEVIDRGGEPTVVLVWSGSGCGAYRTLPQGEGTAYGWGVARTREEADAIAQREVAKYSEGRIASNYVWGCNEKASEPLTTIYRDSNMRTVKLAGFEWSLDNLAVTRFRNGDPIRAASDVRSFVSAKDPAYLCPNSQWCERHGYFYNAHAVHDPRGLAPVGWRIPSVAEWNRLIAALGGERSAGRRLRKPGAWPPWSARVTDPSGFDLEPIGGSFTETWLDEADENEGYIGLWSTGIEGKWALQMRVSSYDSHDEAEAGGGRSWGNGLVARLIREPYSSAMAGTSHDDGPIRPATAPPAQAPTAPQPNAPPPAAATGPSAAERAAAEEAARRQAVAEADRMAVEERRTANEEMADFATRQVAENEAALRKAAADKAAYEAAVAEREQIIRENEAAAAERERIIRENEERHKAAMADWERRAKACRAGDRSACDPN